MYAVFIGRAVQTVVPPANINLQLADGTAAAPSLNFANDTNTGIFRPAADTIAFTEGGTEVMRIDSDGDVGIGTSSPSNILDVSRDTVGGTNIRVTNTNANTSYRASYQLKTGASANVWQMLARNGGFFIGVDGTADYLNIDSGGSVRIGGTTSFSLNERLALYGTATPNNPTIVSTKTAAGSVSSNHVLFENSNGYVGSITTNASATAYNTSSDYRLKENVNYDFDATTRLKQLKPARFNFIADANRTVDGFLAHEVQLVIPEAIHGTKDETETKEKVVVNYNGRVIAQNIEQADWEAGKILNEEGKSQYPIDSTWEASKVVPVYQGIDQAKLTPILTKALQEAIAKIESLEARLTTLENN
jgi:hypothetical protein